MSNTFHKKSDKSAAILIESFVAYITTVFTWIVAVFLNGIIENGFNSINWSTIGAWILYAFLLAVIILGCVNTLFLNLLRVFKKFRITFKNCLVESSLCIGIFYIIQQIISSLPEDARFQSGSILNDSGEVIAYSYGVKTYFSSGFQFLYTYIILFLIYAIYYHFIIQKPKTKQ